MFEKKNAGTLEQLFVTPVQPFGLLLGKLLPYFGIGFFELCLIVTAMRFVFRRSHSRQRYFFLPSFRCPIYLFRCLSAF